MDHAEQKAEFDKLVTRARKAGLLKFDHEGIAIIELPPAPAVSPAASSSVASDGAAGGPL